jgi:hypothetical protein
MERKNDHRSHFKQYNYPHYYHKKIYEDPRDHINIGGKEKTWITSLIQVKKEAVLFSYFTVKVTFRINNAKERSNVLEHKNQIDPVAAAFINPSAEIAIKCTQAKLDVIFAQRYKEYINDINKNKISRGILSVV